MSINGNAYSNPSKKTARPIVLTKLSFQQCLKIMIKYKTRNILFLFYPRENFHSIRKKNIFVLARQLPSFSFYQQKVLKSFFFWGGGVEGVASRRESMPGCVYHRSLAWGVACWICLPRYISLLTHEEEENAAKTEEDSVDLRTLRAIRVLRPLKLVSGVPSKFLPLPPYRLYLCPVCLFYFFHFPPFSLTFVSVCPVSSFTCPLQTTLCPVYHFYSYTFHLSHQHLYPACPSPVTDLPPLSRLFVPGVPFNFILPAI